MINPDFILSFISRFKTYHRTRTNGTIIKNSKAEFSINISSRFTETIMRIGIMANKTGWMVLDLVKCDCNLTAFFPSNIIFLLYEN